MGPRKRQQTNSTASVVAGGGRGGGVDFLPLHQDSHAFKPIHLYPGQIALHTSFTPPHMPLPVHLGTLRYKSTKYNTDGRNNTDDLFSPQPPMNPVPFLRQLQGTNEFPTSVLTEHTGIRIMFNNPTHTGHLLPEHSGNSTRASLYKSLRHDNTSDLGVEVDFNRLMAHNASIAGESWNQVLSAMNAASTIPSANESNSKSDIDSAVVELNMLLERMDMEDIKDDIRRSSGGRRGQVTFHRRGKMMRMVTRREVEVDDEDVALDSVKRKRKKKISKHKYKKRRKATRSERKKLGK